jgi:aminotransferase
MRDFLNAKTRALQPSGIRKFFDIVRETDGAISLGVGEPDFVTPWQVRAAAIDSLRRGKTQYTANRGMPALTELIARYLEERFSLPADPAHILVTVGASEGIDLILRACVEPGDEVLIPSPAYVSYAPCVTMSDGVPVPVECLESNRFVPTPDALERAITDKTKILILTYPNNPTGGIATKADLEKIAAVVKKHDLFVVSDEIYAELTYGCRHTSFAALPDMRERTAYVGGFSKSFAMTGWRLGFVSAPKAVDEGIFKIHQYTVLCAPITAQYAAIEALKDGFSDNFASVEEMRDSYDQRRRFLVKALQDATLPCFEPQGAFYAFPSVKNTGLSDEEFATKLLTEEKVAVVPGSAFGTFGANHVRLSYATGMSALNEAMERISRFTRKYL